MATGWAWWNWAAWPAAARRHRAGTAVARCGEIIGVALRTSLLRGELLDLLEETQRQSEELQAQQEELRVANEELEEQSRSLQHSQASLEQQQAELEQTNVQLEERTHELEGQRQRLLNAQSELVRNSQELATASRYKSEFLGQHVARAAYPAQQLADPGQAACRQSRRHADRRAGQVRASDPLVQQRPAGPDQRHPRPVQDRGRPHRAVPTTPCRPIRC